MPVQIDFSSGIGRRELDAVRRRFMALNQARLARIAGELRSNQQDYLRLLPLLCHINHPSLPGFVNNDTPAGLPAYQPGREELDLARRVCRSFQYKRQALQQFPIQALYIMGSVGSIGHTRGSDLDIWLCHTSRLAPAALEVLAAKARRLEQWAEELGLEVHFFLMDADKFRNGQLSPLSGDSCGSTQHRLLLEEFYRSALLLAGRYPLWWLVPPEREGDYTAFAAELLRKRFVNASECLDFGGLAETRGDEFFGTALWQLYKGIYSPYKAVLKILLTEAYAESFPEPDWLALKIKRAVYRGDAQGKQMDAYLLMYQAVEDYLLRQRQPRRLELARRCLYFKVGVALSRPQPNPDWRTRCMLALVREWGWAQARLHDLDGRGQWKIDRVIQERDSLVRELNRSYRLLTEFASGDGEEIRVDPVELNLLGRKLYTTLEHRPGKVELVNPGISQDLSETDLSLSCRQADGRSTWALCRGRNAPLAGAEEDPACVKLTECLLEQLAWCLINGLAAEHTRFHVRLPGASIGDRELQGMLRVLDETLPPPVVLDAPLANLARPPHPLTLLLVVNVGADPMQALHRDGIHLISDQSDPLNYGSGRRNLLENLELLVHTSWGELVAQRHDGPRGLLDALCYYLDLRRRAPSDAAVPDLRVAGFSSSEAVPLAQRVEQVFREPQRFFAAWPDGRYVLGLGGRLYQLEHAQRGFRWIAHEDLEDLLESLGQPRVGYSPPACDPGTLLDTPLPALFHYCAKGEQQLFYHSGQGRTRVYVLDESGSLFQQDFPLEDARFLLVKAQRFLESLARLRRLSGVTDEAASMITGPRFYRIEDSPQGGWQILPARLPRHGAVDDYLELALVAESENEQVRVLSLRCGDQVYSALKLGDRLFDAVVSGVLAYRKGDDYPIYLTSVELIQHRYGVPPCGVELLVLKRRVEEHLNLALQRQRQTDTV